MCGIAGIFSFDGRPVDLEELRRMCAALYHRGPNDDGFYIGADVGLGMRRLSIIDLKTGRQPVSNEDRSVWVVFNGEIYNFQELREDLERKGHRFATGTDTEVIVHLYEELGTGCVEKLRGMFGIALWDDRRKELLLARDRVGIKPLYYTRAAGRLVFASELKAILQLSEIRRDIDWRAFDHLLSFLATPPDESIVDGVLKLEPGHLLTASRERGVRTESYWNLRFAPEPNRDEAYFAGRLRELLEESVRLHLASDVPLGAFLSGGIDSSAVVATMARLGRAPVRTFSIGFGEKDYDELAYARLVAERYGTEHHELVLEPDVMEVIEDLAWYLDEPFGDSSAIPTYMVSKLAAEHVTVILSGDGGDELFGGYDKYAVEERERGWNLPGPLRRLLGTIARAMPPGMKGRNFARHFALSGWERYLDALVLFRQEEKKEILTREAYEAVSGDDPLARGLGILSRTEGHWLSRVQYFDLMSYLPLDILTKVDRMSMAHSLEARVPLLDHRLIEFAATIPPGFLLRKGLTKQVFKQAMKGILPDPVIERKKQGFAIPLGRWFGGRLGSFVRELLLSRRSRQRGILNPAYVEKLLRLNENGRPLDLHLWTLMSFELWCRAFLDRSPETRLSLLRPRLEVGNGHLLPGGATPLGGNGGFPRPVAHGSR